MTGKLFILVFVVTIPIRLFGQQDSLVDVFPLSVGNQWVFDHSSSNDDYLADFSSQISGITKLTVVDKTDEPESTQWTMRQYRDLVGSTYYFFSGNRDTFVIQDTSEFTLIELHADRHRLYRTGNEIEIRQSEFPFFYELTDSTMVYRYFPIDSAGVHTFSSSLMDNTYPWLTFTFSFKQGIGPINVSSESYLVGVSFGSNHVLRSSFITSVEAPAVKAFPSGYVLEQNYPNPFNPMTTIKFRTPARTLVSLKVYDILGQELETLFNGETEAGEYSVQWNAERFSSGVYIYALTTNGYTERKRMVLLR